MQVFPMYVGVIPSYTAGIAAGTCIPHVRGGDPVVGFKSLLSLSYSPCTWG